MLCGNSLMVLLFVAVPPASVCMVWESGVTPRQLLHETTQETVLLGMTPEMLAIQPSILLALHWLSA